MTKNQLEHDHKVCSHAIPRSISTKMQKHHDHGNELKWVTTWKVDAADKGSILEHSKYFRQGSSWWLLLDS